MYNFDKYFSRYEKFDPKVPVWCLTPNDGCYTHRFFDTIPVSPSGRYLAVLNMPYEDRDAAFGDEAEVVVVDLFSGEEKVVYKTKGWQHQLGANINWGESDSVLIFNDCDTENFAAFSVKLDIFTGVATRLPHEIYHVSPNGKYGVSSNLIATYKTQYGYGVTVPDDKIPLNTVSTEDDGVWVVDIANGTANMILSLKEIFDKTHTKQEISFLKDGICYVFHTKWSPDSKKIMFSTRWAPKEKINDFDLNADPEKPLLFCVYTCNADGSNLEVSIDETQWCKGGHHTTWHPTSEYLTMNLNIEQKGMKLCKADLTGRRVEKLINCIPGSGHPSIHPKYHSILTTDTYVWEEIAYGDGSVPIRLVNLDKQEECATPIRVNIIHEGAKISGRYRVDPHVVWDKTGDYCLFNAHIDGSRRIMIAYMADYIQEVL